MENETGKFNLSIDIDHISKTEGIEKNRVRKTVDLLDQGMTIPFIARYRKEHTGNLTETDIKKIQEQRQYQSDLNARKETVLNAISEQNALTAELKRQILNTRSKTELEDLYLPFKPKRSTKGEAARKLGLEPLAYRILNHKVPGNQKELAQSHLQQNSNVNSLDDALRGAADIIAEKFSENVRFRSAVRDLMHKQGKIVSAAARGVKEQRTKFEDYYDFSEPLKRISAHRFLAIKRGEKEKVLKCKVDISKETLIDACHQFIFKKAHPRAPFLLEVLKESLKRLIFPSLENDIFAQLKEQSDRDAIDNFESNLRSLLMAPPAGPMTVIGIDPGFRTGCKAAVIDKTGKLLNDTTIYPTKPKADIDGASKLINDWVKRYRIDAIAIGNGTASKETYAFVKKHISDVKIISIVNEAGASVYSASDLAVSEFPDKDITVRGAVSIARRFQDPLAELVKIDPKSIGVGMYQHDVNQTLLKDKLDTVVEAVVNRVGVSINQASESVLKYVSGIGPKLAENIVRYREENGFIKERSELLNIPKFGEKAFLLSAGFLRIPDGCNPLDATGIHPESYPIVDRIGRRLDMSTDTLIRNESVLKGLDITPFIDNDSGKYTLTDIIKELIAPGRDPREDFENVEFDQEIDTISDLSEGMILEGIVTNVTDFGAFIDIGVHQDGLVHISEMANRFIKKPAEVVSTGDRVSVIVIGIDEVRKRISLSMKQLAD